MQPNQICHDEQRRIDARRKPLNGIDYIDVERGSGSPALPILLVYFFRAAPDDLTVGHIGIQGGARITGIKATDVQLSQATDAGQEGCARVTVNKDGDFSTYTLRITGLAGFDPVYSSFDFTFKPDCPGDIDCKDEKPCPPKQGDEPEINYLAKDYQGFRQLILDRWAQILPEWKERHVPDLGIALAEILAYTGDYLSYYQDAVATEAYIGTALQRISVRRHARLIDSYVHEGCNARALLSIETGSDTRELDPADFYFITNSNADDGNPIVVDQSKVELLPPSGYEVFEPVATGPLRFYHDRNQISFYTWGDRQCCLPKGSTIATLKDGWGQEPPPDPALQYDRKAPAHHEQPERVWGNKKAHHPQEPSASPARARKLDSLKTGDLLVFMEVLGPDTGVAPDADPLRRHPVRITRLERAVDELYDQPVVNIWWDAADALPFTLCLSSIGRAPQCEYNTDVSVAYGNVILVDHGRRIDNDPLDGCVPLVESVESCLGEGRPSGRTRSPGDFRPVLRRGPLTYAEPLRANTPASMLFRQDSSQALPQIKVSVISLTGVWEVTLKTGHEEQRAVVVFEQTCGQLEGSYSGAHGSFNISGTIDGDRVNWMLIGTPKHDPSSFSATLVNGVLEGKFVMKDAPGTFHAAKHGKETPWTPRRDLLSSGPHDNHFVVEVDNDGLTHFRFGDGESGRAPEAGASAVACYRVGGGPAGNLGVNTIGRMVLRNNTSGLEITRVFNPLPAAGGVAPEDLQEVKLLAPSAFRGRLERAITADDYATLAGQNPKVQRAAAVLRFTGSRYAVQVAIDPLGSEVPGSALIEEIKCYLYRYRRIGHDLEVVPACYVPLDIEMTVCVRPAYLAAHVKAALLDTLGTNVLSDGRLGFFNPDNLTFGDSIYLSRLIGSAQAVAGVLAVEVTKLQRLYHGDASEIENGVLPIGPLEIARLDSDPNFPENGRLKLTMRGGR